MATHQSRELIDAQLADLEPRCLDLQKQIQLLKIQRNTLAPVAKLPDDVLLEIFALTQIISPEDDWYREVTHVCRRWRHIAIRASTLWTNPPLLRHHFTVLMLERSKPADLTIRMEYGTTYRTIEKVLDCISRIEKLEISLEKELLEDTRNLMAKGRQSAPQLRRFMLHSFSEPWDSRRMFALPTFSQSHLLRELDITNVIFDWNILPLPNLVFLQFIDVSLPLQVSMQRFFDTLRQMPLLKSLRIPISRSLFSLPLPTAAIGPVGNVVLPRLRRLEAGDSNFDYLQYFLDRLTAPKLQRLYVGPSRMHPHSSNYPNIAQTVARSITCGDFGNFDSLDLYGTFFHWNTFRGKRRVLGAMDNDTPHLHFSVRNSLTSGRHFAQTSVDILLLCRANFTQLVELKIEGFSITTDELYRLSTILYSVRKVEIFRDMSSVSAFIKVLAMLPPHLPAQPTMEVPFPALDSVVFSVIDFADNEGILQALCGCLMLRYEYGFDVQKLDLFECWIFTGQFALLEEIVVNVRYSETMR